MLISVLPLNAFTLIPVIVIAPRLLRIQITKPVNNISKYVRNAVILAFLLTVFILALAFLGIANDPDTGKQLHADFEFTRLAIPRRVYTQAHLDIIADALIAIKERAGQINHGYRITWEPPILRHFQAHLEPVQQ